MKVLFATSELSPVASVGGLAVAAAGLVRALRDAGVEVTVVLPDYGGAALEERSSVVLDVPPWAGPAVARHGVIAGVGPITLVRAYGSVRAHPYLQPDGTGWPDNDRRFFAFSAAVAALAELERPDVLHLNDWHTSAALAFLFPRPPTVLTIHNLAYQGGDEPGLAARLPPLPRGVHPRRRTATRSSGGIRLADAIVAVSPTYAREILTDEYGMGVDDVLRARQERLVGILNGIDTTVWDPAARPPPGRARTPGGDLAGKAGSPRPSSSEMGLPDLEPARCWSWSSRLVEQKGVDLARAGARTCSSGCPLQVAVLGDGDAALAARAGRARPRASRSGSRSGRATTTASPTPCSPAATSSPCRAASSRAASRRCRPCATGRCRSSPTSAGCTTRSSTSTTARGTGTGVVASAPTSLAVLDALHRGVRAHAAPRPPQGDAAAGHGRTTGRGPSPARQHTRASDRLARRRADRGSAHREAQLMDAVITAASRRCS